jgi:hypothetical protein
MPTAPLMILSCSQNKLCGARMRPLTAAGYIREIGLATLVMVAGGLVSRTGGGLEEARKDLAVQLPVAEERGQKVRQVGNRLLSRNCMENRGRKGTLATISGMRGHQVRQRLLNVARMVVGEEEVAEEARRGERLGVVCNAPSGRTQTVSICLLNRTCLSGFYSECVGQVRERDENMRRSIIDIRPNSAHTAYSGSGYYVVP